MAEPYRLYIGMNEDLLRAFPSDDRARLATTLRHIVKSAHAPLLMVGSIALRYHLLRLGRSQLDHSLHDVDMAVFDAVSLPAVEEKGLLVSHYHPASAVGNTGRMLLQLVDEGTRLRIDIFHALAGALDRGSPIADCPSLFVVSIEDMLVRSLLVLQAQVEAGMVVAKYLQTIQRLSDIVDMERANWLWVTVCHADQPQSIDAAIARAEVAVLAQPSSGGDVEYGGLNDPPCELCVPTDRYPLADKQRIFDILGYI